MQCKKALEEANGDIEKAKIILRKLSGAAAAKKADRTLGAGTVQAYVHATNEVAGVVVLSCETDFVSKNKEFISLAYDIAMHVAAQAPEFLKREDVGEEALNNAREVFTKEIKDKPADLQEKILTGKIDTYFKEKILLEQDFIKDTDRTIQDLVNEAAQKFGERVEVVQFARYSVR
jgi:elongation factor Ts